MQGAVDVVPLLGAIVGCHCWVPLQGAIVVCYSGGKVKANFGGAIAGCQCRVPL